MPETIPYADPNGESRSLSLRELDALRSRHRGPVLPPGGSLYEDTCRVFNTMIDARPALVVRPSGVADVVEAVRFARRHDMLTSVRAGGHNVAGRALADGGLVVDLRDMRAVRVDPERRRARVEGGALLGDVDRETQLHGLAAPLGAVSLTGVAGLTLCGGYGWLRSRFGMACDAVRAFELVTAEGSVVRADEEENSDLLWALRGGGGNFGVVTGFEFELHPVGPEVLLVGVGYPTDRAREVMTAWARVMESAPPELETNVLGWTLPDVEDFPVEARGRDAVLIGGCWSGPIEEGLDAVRPLRELGGAVLDLTGPMDWCEVQKAFDPYFRSGERRNYWKSMYLDRFDAELIDLLADRLSRKPDPWTLVGALSLRGRCRDEPPGGSAMGNRDARWLVSADTSWTDPAKDEECLRWARDLWTALRPWSGTGGTYLNFAGFGEEGDAMLRASYGAEHYARLSRVKATWDPDNFFRMNLNVRPTAPTQSPD